MKADYGTIYFKSKDGPSGEFFGLTLTSQNDYSNNDPKARINFWIYDQATKALLNYEDNNSVNNILPVSIELIGMGEFRFINGAAIVQVMISYYDETHTLQTINSEMLFELDENATCNDVIGYTTNPFVYGREIAWRKQKDWAFYGNRKAASNINLRKDGTITNFESYWKFNSGKWEPGNNTGWTCTNEITRYSRNGEELENKDALGRYSAAIFSRKFMGMPLAVAANSRYGQIGVENVEEAPTGISCNQKALDFEHFTQTLGTTGHTGKFSIKLEHGDLKPAFLKASHAVKTEEVNPDRGKAGNITVQNDYTGFFNPSPGKYVFGAWVKVKASGTEKQPSYHYGGAAAHAEVVVNTSTSPVSVVMYPKGQIIEGWQRIEGEFIVGSNCTSVEFFLHRDGNTSSITYFDDMRVHPFDGKLKTYVYNQDTQLLSAELDENNYATFYEYNAEGKLVRVKKETEKGIVTLKEVRSNQHKVINP